MRLSLFACFTPVLTALDPDEVARGLWAWPVTARQMRPAAQPLARSSGLARGARINQTHRPNVFASHQTTVLWCLNGFIYLFIFSCYTHKNFLAETASINHVIYEGRDKGWSCWVLLSSDSDIGENPDELMEATGGRSGGGGFWKFMIKTLSVIISPALISQSTMHLVHPQIPHVCCLLYYVWEVDRINLCIFDSYVNLLSRFKKKKQSYKGWGIIAWLTIDRAKRRPRMWSIWFGWRGWTFFSLAAPPIILAAGITGQTHRQYLRLPSP